MKLPADPGMCACGQPLHYTDDAVRRFCDSMVEQFGENVVVNVGLRRWLVQRHYIALHGLAAKELPQLGFPEVGPDEFIMR